MIGMRLDEAKTHFLDRIKVLDAEKRASMRSVGKYGAYVRRSAKSSIGHRARISEPGQPPSDHVGLLKQNIFFVVEDNPPNVTIGPILLNTSRSKATLKALEEGGESLLVMRDTKGFHAKGHNFEKLIAIRARPFMKPAQQANIHIAEKLWMNSIQSHG